MVLPYRSNIIRTNKIWIPPIKCQGIKSKLVLWIKNYAEKGYNPEGRWIEPFLGSGVVGFNLNPANG